MIAAPTDESKDTLKKYEELKSEIRNLIRSITYKTDDYDEKYMKINLIQMMIYL